MDDGRPVARARARSPRSSASSTCRSRTSSSSPSGSTRCSAGSPRTPTRLVRPGRDARRRLGDVALIGIFFAWTLYRRGLADRSVDPLNERLGPVARLFGHAYYFDDGISRAVDGPIRRAAQAGSPPPSTSGSSTARSTASPGCSAARRLGAAPRADRARPPVRARDRPRRRRSCSSTRLAGGLVMDGFPILTAHHRDADRRARSSRLCTPARRPELAQAVGYIATAATLGFAAWLLWDFHTGVGTFQFVEETGGSTRSASATSSASTASASSWSRSPRCCSRSGCSRRRRSTTGSRRTRSGSCCSRARSWGSSSPST